MELRKAIPAYREAIRQLQLAEQEQLKKQRSLGQRLEEKAEEGRRIKRLKSHDDFVQSCKTQYEFWEQALHVATTRARQTQGTWAEPVTAGAQIEAIKRKKDFYEKTWMESRRAYADLATRGLR